MIETQRNICTVFTIYMESVAVKEPIVGMHADDVVDQEPFNKSPESSQHEPEPEKKAAHTK